MRWSMAARMMPHLRWIFGISEDDPPPKRVKPLPDGPVLRQQILDALNDDDTGTVLRTRWPWVPPPLRVVFVIRHRHAASDAEEDELVARYEQTIRAHAPGRHSRRWLRRKGTR